MTVSKRLRFEILRRDDHTCRYCGSRAPDVKLTVDHVLAVALGGTDEASNLVTACSGCNSGKSATAADQTVVEDVTADALRWARAIEVAASMRNTKQSELDEFTAAFRVIWDKWTWTDSTGTKYQIELPGSWRNTIERFHGLGLEIEFLQRAVEKAMNMHGLRGEFGEFRYFCGICYRTIDDQIKVARDLIEKDLA